MAEPSPSVSTLWSQDPSGLRSRSRSISISNEPSSRTRSSSISSQASSESSGSRQPLMMASTAPESRLGPDNDGENHCLEVEEGGMGATTPVIQTGQSRRISRKLDLGLIPLLSVLYLCNGLDRGNIGNAETQGFTHDIGVEPDDLNFAVMIFFVTFVVLQPISAAAGRWFGPENWIPLIMFAWGVLTVSQAFIHGKASLIATRLLIGAFEAGFYPTAVSYLSTFYPPFELAQKLAWFYGQYAVSGAFSGVISYGIFQIQHPILKGWQLLFIFEGVVTCAFALVAWIWLPAGPNSAWFLTDVERSFAAKRVVADQYNDASASSAGGRLASRDITETLRDWKIWLVLACNVCVSVPSTAFSVFLPLVVEGMGYSALEANLMSVPPFVCGGVGLYLFAMNSDRRKERGYHIVAGILVALVGLILVVTVPTTSGKYVALCVLLFGSYVPPLLTAAWLSGNTPAPGKRAIVLGVMGLGNLAGAIGSGLYKRKYAPGYRTPFFVTLGFVSAALVGYLSYRQTLKAVNRKRAAIRRGKTAAECDTEVRTDQRYADSKWTFVYNL